MSGIKEVLDRAIEDGIMTRDEHEAFIDLIHKDGSVDPDESEQISRMFRLIQAGKLKVVDDVREQSADRKRAETIRKNFAS